MGTIKDLVTSTGIAGRIMKSIIVKQNNMKYVMMDMMCIPRTLKDLSKMQFIKWSNNSSSFFKASQVEKKV